MITILLFFTIFFIVAFFLYRFPPSSSKSNKRNKNKANIESWMGMTREERNASDAEEKKNSFKRKKILLDQIRKEYKDYSKSKIKKSN